MMQDIEKQVIKTSVGNLEKTWTHLRENLYSRYSDNIKNRRVKRYEI